MPSQRLSFQRLVRLLIVSGWLLGLLIVLFAHQGLANGQANVTAEAIQHANLRSGPGVDFPQVGAIDSGTQYTVVGRSAHFPWLMLALPTTRGWVFKDLVKVTGDINTIPYNEDTLNTPAITLTDAPTDSGNVSTDPASTPATSPASTDADTQAALPSLTASMIASLTPSLTVTRQPGTGVFVEAKDSTNVRYGPGIDFPKIGTINKGQQYPILRRHTLYPWLEIALGGNIKRGWVYQENVTITGILSTVAVTSSTDFGYPTLTPTGAMVVTSVPPWTVTPAAFGRLTKLGDDIYNYLLKLKFEPGTDKQGSAFLMDLQTGEHVSLNPGIAYSGMSIIKIPILVSLYRKLPVPPTKDQAALIAEMMVCSDDEASNQVLRIVGDGDVYKGSDYVTSTMQGLGLKDTFIVGPLSGSTALATGPKPTAPPVGVNLNTVKTTVDQKATDPDPYNQSTPDNLGWLLSGIYQCALDGTGPLNQAYPDTFTTTECRQMIRAMRADDIPALIRAGVPAGIPVAHKHGWVNETHGDAGLVSTPGGDYILVVLLHNKTWLDYNDSFPAIAEISRIMYNTYNPSSQLAQTNTKSVPFCSIDTVNASDPKLIDDLQTSDMPPIR